MKLVWFLLFGSFKNRIRFPAQFTAKIYAFLYFFEDLILDKYFYINNVLQISSEPVKASSELSQSSIESVMQALTARFRSRLALSSQMNEVGKFIHHKVLKNIGIFLLGSILLPHLCLTHF